MQRPSPLPPAEITIVLDQPLPGVEEAVDALRQVELKRRRVKFDGLLALLAKFTPGETNPNEVSLPSIRSYPPVARLRVMIDLGIHLVMDDFVSGLNPDVRPRLISQWEVELTTFSA